MSKIGILGGAFDPPHIGHIALAEQVKKELKLASVLIIPTANPPHKEKSAVPFRQRFEMAALAFGDKEGYAVSDIEHRLGGQSYTINTLRALKEILPPKTEMYFMIGGDQLFTIEKWYRYEAVLKECRVVAVTRGDMSYTDMQEYANEIGRIRVLNCDIPDISSSEIRAKAAAGEDISDMVPEKVLEYIGTEGLYRG